MSCTLGSIRDSMRAEITPSMGICAGSTQTIWGNLFFPDSNTPVTICLQQGDIFSLDLRSQTLAWEDVSWWGWLLTVRLYAMPPVYRIEGFVPLYPRQTKCRAPDRRNTMCSGRLVDVGKWHHVEPKIYHGTSFVHEISADLPCCFWGRRSHNNMSLNSHPLSTKEADYSPFMSIDSPVTP